MLRTVFLTFLCSLVLSSAGAVADDLFVSGDFRYLTPQLHSYWVPGNTLITARDQSGSQRYERYADGYGIGRSAGVSLSAPVRLPDGATVAGMICYYYDNFTANRLKCISGSTITLRRRNFASSTAEPLAQVNINTCLQPANSSVRGVTDTSIDNGTVGNFAYAYHLDVDWQTSDQLTENLRFYGCVIDYTIDRLAP
jgi:hypothetical protein